MKITPLLALLMIAFTLAACDSTTSTTKKADPKPVAKTTDPLAANPGTAGNPNMPPRNGQYGGVDPMSTGTDGRMPYKNY